MRQRQLIYFPSLRVSFLFKMVSFNVKVWVRVSLGAKIMGYGLGYCWLIFIFLLLLLRVP